MSFLYKDIASVLDISIPENDYNLVITGFSTDTRSIKAGMMFVAIPGENYDGGNYVEEALKKGATAVITEKNIKNSGVLVVNDAIKALGLIAADHKKKSGIPLIAVTGSTGKTTTRNFVTSVLNQRFKVHGTKGNLNNHIGLPMTLLEIDESHDMSVVEMGMSGFGEIDYLADISKPDIGIITNIGMSHIGILGSRENILRAKSELVPHIKPDGVLIINGDDDFLMKHAELTTPKVLTFGTKEHNIIRFTKAQQKSNGFYTFEVGNQIYNLNIRGFHNIYNSMAAIAVGMEFGLSTLDISNGLLAFKNEKQRLDIFKTNGFTVINDAYNASPDSLKAAIDILSDFDGRKIAVIGDMLEMGEYSQAAHKNTGMYVALKADLLICVGNEADNIANGAYESGMDSDSIFKFITSDESGEYLKDIVTEGDVVLVKGSRGMKMENVLKYIDAGGNNICGNLS